MAGFTKPCEIVEVEEQLLVSLVIPDMVCFRCGGALTHGADRIFAECGSLKSGHLMSPSASPVEISPCIFGELWLELRCWIFLLQAGIAQTFLDGGSGAGGRPTCARRKYHAFPTRMSVLPSAARRNRTLRS